MPLNLSFYNSRYIYIFLSAMVFDIVSDLMDLWLIASISTALVGAVCIRLGAVGQSRN